MGGGQAQTRGKMADGGSRGGSQGGVDGQLRLLLQLPGSLKPWIADPHPEHNIYQQLTNTTTLRAAHVCLLPMPRLKEAAEYHNFEQVVPCLVVPSATGRLENKCDWKTSVQQPGTGR